jgi:hypothetical protein
VAADDVADEADLAFTLGASAYQRGDYRAALQQFLLSQRLVANQNVVFNIARCYDKLAEYPQAYRYYVDALSGESDATAISKIESELARLSTRIGVLSIETSPPGATLYLERKDLGAVGTSPQRLGVAPGSYRIIAELPGYQAAQVDLQQVKVGQALPVVMRLEPLLGQVMVRSPRGAELRVGEPGAALRCRLPCQLSLPPGPHRLFVQRARYHVKRLDVEVVANQALTLAPQLEPLTGLLQISTDEPGALVRVDGQPRGFSPTLVTVPVGVHEVRVELEGFRDETYQTTVREDEETNLTVAMTRADEVANSRSPAPSFVPGPRSPGSRSLPRPPNRPASLRCKSRTIASRSAGP